MILLDSDVLLIDLRYPNDPRFVLNRQVLQRLAQVPLGVMSQTLLEVVGNLSFNTPVARIPQLPSYVATRYRLAVFPSFQQCPDYAGCTVFEVLTQMERQMALGDAVLVVQVARYAPFSQVLLTWNARHFVGKLVIPVLTPQDWLAQQGPSTP
jgi:hypothetical protein